MKTKLKETSSPIKDLPLHNPGQSLEAELNRFIDDDLMGWGVIGAVTAGLIVMEWCRWFFAIGPSPGMFTAVGLIAIVVVTIRFRSGRRYVHRLRLGLGGERAVGQYLQNALLRNGYWVVHDVCEDNYNIDHVLIGPGGSVCNRDENQK